MPKCRPTLTWRRPWHIRSEAWTSRPLIVGSFVRFGGAGQDGWCDRLPLLPSDNGCCYWAAASWITTWTAKIPWFRMSYRREEKRKGSSALFVQEYTFKRTNFLLVCDWRGETSSRNCENVRAKRGRCAVMSDLTCVAHSQRMRRGLKFLWVVFFAENSKLPMIIWNTNWGIDTLTLFTLLLHTGRSPKAGRAQIGPTASTVAWVTSQPFVLNMAFLGCILEKVHINFIDFSKKITAKTLIYDIRSHLPVFGEETTHNQLLLLGLDMLKRTRQKRQCSYTGRRAPAWPVNSLHEMIRPSLRFRRESLMLICEPEFVTMLFPFCLIDNVWWNSKPNGLHFLLFCGGRFTFRTIQGNDSDELPTSTRNLTARLHGM